MKYWVWLILLGAGGATAYVLFSSPGDRPEKPAASSPASEIAAENPERQDVTAPPSNPQGGPNEMILPLDAGLKKPKVDKPTEENEGPDLANRHDENADNADHDDRDLILGDLPRNEPRTFHKLRPKNTDTAAPGPSAPAFAPTSAAALSAPSFSAPSAPSGSSSSPSASSGGLGSSPSLGGSFPALPQSAAAAAGFANGTSSPPSSSSSSTATVPVSQKIVTPVVADRKTASLPKIAPKAPGGSDELIKPANPPSPTAMDRIPGPETQTTDGAQESAWMDAMKIPAGFAGLSIFPATITASSPNQALSSVTESPPAVLGATWKSSFDASDKPTLQIVKECPETLGECDPLKIPTGGPALIDYFYQGERHQEDLDADPKTFGIGTTVIGTTKDALGKEVPQSEAAFHLSPGFVPGKYQVVLSTPNTKLTGSFEVISPPATAQAAIESAASRTTNGIPQSLLPPPQKPPAPK